MIGAYGGNKQLMALCQILAAKWSRIDCLYFHTFQKSYTQHYLAARKNFKQMLKKVGPEDCVNAIFRMKFSWGHSDKN